MGLKHLYRKSVNYYKKKGLFGSLKRIPHKLRWTVFRKRDILYMCELTRLADESGSLPDWMTIVRRESVEQIQDDEMACMLAGKDPKVFKDQLAERFKAGAVMWLPKYEGKTAGMIWTISNATLGTHYFCVLENDAHFFNGEVFGDYRGKRILSLLVNGILVELKKEGLIRAFLETNSANAAAIKGISKMNVRKIATARVYRLFGRNVTIWNKIDHSSDS